MRDGEFFTWSRAVNIGVVDGRIPSEEMRERTLGITYTDRVRSFDHIEWSLDNRDGKLTRPEYICTGFVVRLQLGYANGTFPWKAFIINRVSGGLGVWGRDTASVGDSEARVTFYGRNRNAAGGRSSKSWGRSARPAPKKPPKVYGATTDITSQEMVLGGTDRPRTIYAHTTAQAVEEIARRNGFQGSYALIEETDDWHDGGALALPDGMSDGQALQMLANDWGFIFKIDTDGLHFHSPHWPGAKFEVVDELIYGSTPDILSLSMDCDFTLPLPGKTTTKGYSYRNRAIVASNNEYDQSVGRTNMRIMFSDLLADPAQYAALTRHETFPAVLDALPKAEKFTLQRFVKRYTRAFKVSVECVGNPKLLAGKLVRIGGTGSPFLKKPLYIAEARHTVTANEYKTQVTLTHPPNSGGGDVIPLLSQNPQADKEGGQLRLRTMSVRGWKTSGKTPTLRAYRGQ
jgi:phage protein D